MLYIIVTLAFVIAVPVSFKLGQRRGVRLERESRWLGIESLDDLTVGEALALANNATRNYYGSGDWKIKLTDATTGVKFDLTHKSLPELMKMQARHYVAQRNIKQLEIGS